MGSPFLEEVAVFGSLDPPVLPHGLSLFKLLNHFLKLAKGAQPALVSSDAGNNGYVVRL